MVKCLICGYECSKLLSNHLRLVHKISSIEYRKMFNDAEVVSSEFKDMMSERNKSDKMRNLTVERNKTDKMREAISRRNKDEDFKKKCKDGIEKSESWHEVHSRTASETNKKNWRDPNYRERMINVLMESTPSYGRRNEYFSHKFNKLFKLKSLAEKSFVNLCESLESVTDLKYESLRIKYNSRTYIPDFLAVTNDGIYLVEVKSTNNDPETSKEKVNSAIEYCELNGMKFCWYSERHHSQIKSIEDIVLCRNKIG